MAYTKTTWVNNSTPALNATNLNKIEQGIYDAIPSDIVDAKGDLIVGTADNTVSRLAVGTNNYVLTADSAQAAGVKWDQIVAASIQDGAVTTSKIVDGSVTSAKIGPAAVTTAKIGDGQVTEAKLDPAIVGLLSEMQDRIATLEGTAPTVPLLPYGPAIGTDTIANLVTGNGDQIWLSQRFKAVSTGKITSHRWVLKGARPTGYSGGTGGALRVSVQADDGTGKPNGTDIDGSFYTFSPRNAYGHYTHTFSG